MDTLAARASFTNMAESTKQDWDLIYAEVRPFMAGLWAAVRANPGADRPAACAAGVDPRGWRSLWSRPVNFTVAPEGGNAYAETRN